MADRPTYKELKQRVKELEALETRRKKDQAALDRLFNLSIDMLCVAGIDGYFKMINDAFEKALGHTKETLLKKPFIHFVHPDDQAPTMDAMAQLSRGEPVTNFENRYRCKDGSYKWLAWTSMPVPETGLMYAVARDMTHRKDMEERLERRIEERTGQLTAIDEQLKQEIKNRKQAGRTLRKSEEEYRELVESVHNIVMRMDSLGNITFFNAFAQKFFGFSKDEILNQNLVGTIVPETETTGRDLKLLIEDIRKYPERYARIVNENMRKNGERVWVEWTNMPKYDDRGNVVEIFCVGSDITDRKRAEEKLRKSEERYRNILESILEGYFEVDIRGHFIFFNEALCRIFGVRRDDLMGKHFKDFTDASVAQKGYETFNRVYTTGRPDGSFAWEIRREDDEKRHVESSIYLMRDAEGRKIGFRGMIRDITDRKHAEDELRRAKIEAEAANIAKSQFLANMSHEIRTPMNSVIGFTDMLLDTGLDEEQLDYATAIKRSGASLLFLINDILDFSKVEAGELDFETIEFDPELLAHDVCECIRPGIGAKPVEVLCRIGESLPSEVKGDPGRFRQVLTNLMGNAAKFTDAGEIELQLYFEEEKNDRIKLHAVIRDTGVGVPEDQRVNIFAPFQQADGSITRKYGGSGLGLSISQKISQMMQGDVWAESGIKGGSIFHLTAWFGKAERKTTKRLTPAPLSGKRALIVDDNQANLNILAHILKQGGMNTHALRAGKEVISAIQNAQNHQTPFDLCIIDIQMPVMSGYEVARAIRNWEAGVQKGEDAKRRIPLIALSSLMQRDAKECREAGFDAFLSKPVHREKLYQILVRMAAGEAFESVSEKGTREKMLTQYSIREEIKHSVRILLAEDNPVNQKLAKMMLEKAGYQVMLANNGFEAVETYRASPADFDLIFMDVQMPEMDGIAATRKIRNLSLSGPSRRKLKTRKIPIVAMTAHAMKGDREKCLEAGMDDYMTKPIKREIVLDILKKWVFERDRL